jgi:hypothetical protein
MSDMLGDVDESQNGNGNNRATGGSVRITGDLWSAVIAGAALAVSVVAVLSMWWMQDQHAELLREMRYQHVAELRVMADRNVAAELARSKEYKQIQVQLMYSNAIMLREGLAKPGDMVFGPEGNLEYAGGLKFKRERER